MCRVLIAREYKKSKYKGFHTLFYTTAMIVKKIFTQDLQIAQSLIAKDEMVTRKYFYQQCYPLFKSIFDNYYTDALHAMSS